MIQIKEYDKWAMDCTNLFNKRNDISFALGIHLFDKKFHRPIHTIYGFLQYFYENVDTDKNRAARIEDFKQVTLHAIKNRFSLNPMIHSFQRVVNKYEIEMELIEAFFSSLETDMKDDEHVGKSYNKYLYGSARVFGLIYLKIFCEGDDVLYNQLYEPATRLSSAIKKINSLRDRRFDYEYGVRIYFSRVEFHTLNETTKKSMEEDIQKDFEEAIPVIKNLPEGAASGVRVIYRYYQELFNKIKTMPCSALIERKVRFTNCQKLLILASEKFLYLVLNIFIISCTLPFSFENRIRFYSKWYALFPAILVTGVFFICWDVLFTRKNVWKFNRRHILGYYVIDLPIEEWIFFFTVPYSCVFIYESFKFFFSDDVFRPLAVSFFSLAVPSLLLGSLFTMSKMYTCFNFFIAAVVIIIHCFIFGQKLLGQFFIALIVHYIPFFICNGILTGGIYNSEPVVLYNRKHMLNIRIGTIPIEDIVYSMSLLLVNVSIYEYIQSIF